MKIRIPTLILIGYAASSVCSSAGSLQQSSTLEQFNRLNSPKAFCDQKEAYIGNGKVTTDYTPVVKLTFVGPEPLKKALGNCTGTLVPPANTILFSAHCICLLYGSRPESPMRPAVGSIEVDGIEIVDPYLKIHPSYQPCNAKEPGPREFDLAALKIPSGTGPDPNPSKPSRKAATQVAGIARFPSREINSYLRDYLAQLGTYKILEGVPEKGADVTLVGYGRSDKDEIADGQKRVGTNSISEVDPKSGFIRLVGMEKNRTEWTWKKLSFQPAPDGKDAAPLHGDSGGPLLLDNKVAGIASESWSLYLFGHKKLPIDWSDSYYTPLFITQNQRFLEDLKNWRVP